jgi:hypothetical protein
LRKRKGITCLLLAALALSMVAVLVRPRAVPVRPRGIGPACFQRISSGMSLHEVETVIGLPHGDYFTRPESFDSSTPYWGLREQYGEPVDRLRTKTTSVGSKKVSVRSWRGNDYYIRVAFDEHDSAVAWTLHERLAADKWWLVERVQSWFGEQD